MPFFLVSLFFLSLWCYCMVGTKVKNYVMKLMINCDKLIHLHHNNILFEQPNVKLQLAQLKKKKTPVPVLKRWFGYKILNLQQTNVMFTVYNNGKSGQHSKQVEPSYSGAVQDVRIIGKLRNNFLTTSIF